MRHARDCRGLPLLELVVGQATVAFVSDDRDADGRFDADDDDELGGLTLEPVHAYEWPD
jgi:hypothetical protein